MAFGAASVPATMMLPSLRKATALVTGLVTPAGVNIRTPSVPKVASSVPLGSMRATNTCLAAIRSAFQMPATMIF